MAITLPLSKKATLGIYSASVAIVLLLLSATGATSVGALQDVIIQKEQDDVRSLAVAAGEKFSTLASVMEVTGQLPQLADTLHAAEISPEFKGVPENVEVEKRQVARSILSQNADRGRRLHSARWRDVHRGAFLPSGEPH